MLTCPLITVPIDPNVTMCGAVNDDLEGEKGVGVGKTGNKMHYLLIALCVGLYVCLKISRTLSGDVPNM